ncbi:MAG: aldehyde dehydrogenase family protein, partial [Candidatus Acidiferrales bacterium]
MPVSTKSPAKVFPFLLDGKWVSEGRLLEIESPYDGEPVGTTYWATPENLEAATRAAVRTFEITRRMPVYGRKRILQAISDEIAIRQEEFARLIALEAGKPIKTARAEVARSVFVFAIAAEESGR